MFRVGRCLGFVISFCVLHGAVAGTGSPQSFKRYAGDYEGTGRYKAESGIQQSAGSLASEATISMKSNPTAAGVRILSGGTIGGRQSTASWTFNFGRKKAVTIDIVYPNGNIGRVVGKYQAKKGRITFSGSLEIRTSGITFTGTTEGKIRLKRSQMRVVQRDEYLASSVIVRHKMTKQ